MNKYEEAHLTAYADGREARAGIGSWMTFYNFRRPPQAMNNQMPMLAWRAGMDQIEAAQSAGDMPLRLANATALPPSLRRPFHQASLDGTFGQLRPQAQQQQQQQQQQQKRSLCQTGKTIVSETLPLAA
jgi:uncharacterized protein (DUF2236 family)